MPRLSVLLPVHNGQETIRAAVASTLRAMPKDGELAVFDDASTDATLQELGRFTDRRLSVTSTTETGGVAGALNRLLSATDSEFVARMDADDVCLPWRFRRQLGAISRSSGPHAVFTTVVDWRTPRGGVRPHAPVGITPRAFAVHLTVTNPVSHPTMLAVRGALEEVAGYREVPAEDYDLWMRLQVAGFRLSRLPLPGLAYRIHEAQVSASDQWRRSSWANPLVASVYRDLTSQVLGTGFLRLNVLATTTAIDDEAFEYAIGEFSAAVERAAAALGRERTFLLQVLRRRIGEVRELRARATITDASSGTSWPMP